MIPGPLLRALRRSFPARAGARAGAALLLALAVLLGGGPAEAKKDHPGKQGASQRRADRPQRHAGKGPVDGSQTTPAAPTRPGRAKRPAKASPAKSKNGDGSAKKPAKGAQPVVVAATPPPAPVAAAPAPTPASPASGAGAQQASSERGRARSGQRRRRSAASRRRRRDAGSVRGARGEARDALRRATAAGQVPQPSGSKRAGRKSSPDEHDAGDGPVAPVTRTVRDIVEVVPEPVKMLLAALGILTLMLGGVYAFTAARARRLGRQRSDLLQEVGLLQTALLPPVPATVGAVRTSVAYRPSDGPGAGGDFYDALTLPGGRAAFILGDMSGHGRAALARTAFMRYTMRAYLEAGLEPRAALQVAGRVVGEHLGGDFATVVLAVHDPQSGSLTYACAGHPAPIVVGPARVEPVLAASSPPIGLGLRTGVRQTTVPLPPGSVVCLFTDGLAEARTERGVLGRPRLGDIVEELGRDATAQDLLDRVVREARLVSDDMATVVLTPTAGVTAGGFRTEQLEIHADELEGGLAEQFLEACGNKPEEVHELVAELRTRGDLHGGAVLLVRYGIRGPQTEILPRNVESLEAASRRVAASGDRAG